MSHHISVDVDQVALIKSLEESLAAFEKDFPLQSFKEGDYKQHPAITLLTCSDSRMPVNIFGEVFNRIFSIENIGNQVKTNEGSILYGLLHLRTPLMIIAGHTDCGAIKAAESNFIDEPMGIRNELSVVKNSLEEARRKTGFQFSDDPQVNFTQLAELNVDMQVEYLLNNYALAEMIARKELTLLGVMVDLHNVYGEAYGKTYTSNINGKTKLDEIKACKELGYFAEQAKRLT